jgi:hypothetical protein
MLRLIFLFISLSLIISGCQPKDFSSAVELQKYIQDESNGLKETKQVGDYKIELTYKPTDLLVDQETDGKAIDAEQLKGIVKKYDAYYYFILSLSRDKKEALHNAGGGMDQYSELVQILSFRMAEYVTMTTNTSDTIPLGDFILNRTYGLSTSTDLLLVFNKEKTSDKEWIQVNLNEFGLGVGNQRFRFRREVLDQAPRLVFK